MPTDDEYSSSDARVQKGGGLTGGKGANSCGKRAERRSAKRAVKAGASHVYNGVHPQNGWKISGKENRRFSGAAAV